MAVFVGTVSQRPKPSCCCHEPAHGLFADVWPEALCLAETWRKRH